jgi:hypothetical protein
LYKKLTLIHSGHEEGKSKEVIIEGVGCSQSAVSKHIHEKMTERAKCGRKRCTTTRDEDFEGKPVQELGISASRATTHRRVRANGHNCRIPRIKLAIIEP